MSNSIISILLNIISSGIVLIIVLTWNKWLIPAFKAFVYRGLLLDGTWKISQREILSDGTKLSVKRSLNLILTQKANEIKGDATASLASVVPENLKDRNSEVYYEVKGEIKDRIVSLILLPKDKSSIAYSVFLLEAVSDGTVLRGYRSFYGHKKCKICAIECELVRIK